MWDNNTTVVQYMNGDAGNSNTVTNGIKSLGIFTIGAYETTAATTGSSEWFNGGIAEIILFDRALKTEERKAVEKYLGQKWGFKIAS